MGDNDGTIVGQSYANWSPNVCKMVSTDLADFVKLQINKEESENSWSIKSNDVDKTTFDLSAKNPNKKEEAALRQPREILEEMKALDEESADILNSILELI